MPETCLRALKKKDWVTPEGNVETKAFVADARTAEGRSDSGREVSVNWEDDTKTLEFTMSKRSQSAHGVARLARSAVDRVSRRGLPPYVYCERRADESDRENRYHGNLVYRHDVSPPLEKMVAAALALGSTLVPRDDA